MKKEDGLPNIAENIKSKNGMVVIAAVIVSIVAGIYVVSSKSKQAIVRAHDETYQVEADALPDVRATQAAIIPAKVLTKQEIDEQQAISRAEMTVMAEKQKALQQRLTAPLMVVNDNANKKTNGEQTDKKNVSENANTRFMEEAAERVVKPAQAKSIGSLGTIIAEGSFLHAILEPATDSDLPGHLRAMISEPAYSEDGSKVLVPRGSRLVGEYKSGMMQGQSRVFVVWTRLITPAGLSIQLGSSGVDSLGVSGMGADVIDRHFLGRFGMASLLSIIGAGTASAGVGTADQANSASTYRSALAGSFSQAAGDSLQQDGTIAPTLKTYQGKPIMVFVARDLQFADAIKNTTPSINVF